MNILIPDTVFADDHAVERAAAAPMDIVIENARKAEDLSVDVWSGADALVAHHLMPYDQTIAELAVNARILVRVGVGVDNIDLDAWSARGVPVCNVPDYGTGEVADHALALTLALLRGTAAYHGRIFDLPKDTDFDRMPIPAPVRRIAGLNCLVVGYGAIGRAFADRARALGMTVGFFDPDIAPGSWEVTQVHRFSSLEAGLEVADVVSLHLPLTEKTSNIIDAVALAVMKPDSVLINTARGGLVDTDAVADALKAGALGGVGLDVFPAEPLPSTDRLLSAVKQHKDWARDRVAITPHVGGVSPQSLEELRRRAVEIARDFLADGTLVNRIA
ncbi:MAG: phosphoglycerate dehydrogenase-like enzyme [Paracoccaceae bacterium]